MSENDDDDDQQRNVVEDDGERNQSSETDSDEEEEDEEEDVDDDDGEEDEYPFFQVLMKSNSNYLGVPLRFCKKYIWKQVDPCNIEIKLETESLDQIIHTVDLQPHRGVDGEEHVRGARFTSGWQGFYEDNDLKRQDLCVFKLMKNDRHDIRCFCVCAYRWDDSTYTFTKMF